MGLASGEGLVALEQVLGDRIHCPLPLSEAEALSLRPAEASKASSPAPMPGAQAPQPPALLSLPPSMQPPPLLPC